MNFREMYKKDADMIKPDEAFIEKLSRIQEQRRRIPKTPFALAAAALVIVAVSVTFTHNAKNLSPGCSSADGGAGLGYKANGIAAAPQNAETTYAPEAYPKVDEAKAADEANEANEERAGAIWNAGAGVAGDAAGSVPEYKILHKSETMEIRLYRDGVIEIIIDGQSRYYYGDDIFDEITEGDNG